MSVRSTKLWNIVILSTNISQGTVATHVVCDGTFNYFLARNSLLSFENRSAFGNVRRKTIAAFLHRHGVF